MYVRRGTGILETSQEQILDTARYNAKLRPIGVHVYTHDLHCAVCHCKIWFSEVKILPHFINITIDLMTAISAMFYILYSFYLAKVIHLLRNMRTRFMVYRSYVLKDIPSYTCNVCNSFHLPIHLSFDFIIK